VQRVLFPILYARDLPRLASFYRDILGMAEAFRYPAEGDAAFMTLKYGTAELGLGTYDPTPGLEGRPLLEPAGGRGFELCIYVPDVDEMVGRMQRAGV
jgi:lactoylglutathione lyase